MPGWCAGFLGVKCSPALKGNEDVGAKVLVDCLGHTRCRFARSVTRIANVVLGYPSNPFSVAVLTAARLPRQTLGSHLFWRRRYSNHMVALFGGMHTDRFSLHGSESYGLVYQVSEYHYAHWLTG